MSRFRRQRINAVWWAAQRSTSGVLPGWAAQFNSGESGHYMAAGVSKSFAGAVTLTRASDGTFIDPAGILQTATTDVARFDHDTATVVRLGLLREEEKANKSIWTDDWTNAAYNTVTNITPLKDQTGADGVSNSASSLLATAANGLITQAITIASSTRVYSVMMKRLVGTGDILITQNDFSTSVDVKALINSSTYTQVATASATLTNPVVGIKIVTDTDKVAVQYGFSEEGEVVTSPIPNNSATASVTRARDIISLVVDGSDPFPGYDHTEGTWVAHMRNLGNAGVIQGRIVAGFGTEFALGFLAPGDGFNAFSGSTGLPVSDGGTDTADGNLHKVAMGYDGDGRIIGFNGLTPITDAVSPYLTTTPTLISLGAQSNGAKQMNGLYEAIYWYPNKFTVAEIQAATT